MYNFLLVYLFHVGMLVEYCKRPDDEIFIFDWLTPMMVFIQKASSSPGAGVVRMEHSLKMGIRLVDNWYDSTFLI